jgi:CRISPR-associated endoribonuclease Cas6
MRLHLQIRSYKAGCSIPLNYQYYLASAIYRWIEQSSPTYSTFLHEHGYSREGTARRFKHFCFSQLDVTKRKIENFRLVILSPTLSWYISVPVEETLNHIVVGIFEKQEFYIDDKENRFLIEQVETLPEPQWERTMKFRMLSPTTISIPEERNGKLLPHYLRPDDPRLSEALRQNILHKYQSLNNNDILDDEFICQVDTKFIVQRGGYDKISKLITIKEGLESETKVRGFICPIMIEGNPELIKLAYESGLGEKGSLGFGMIEEMNGK